MNKIEVQYKTAQNLNTRISIHEKYSTNKQPFGDWIVSHYEIRPGFRILELGCGTGDMWVKNLDILKEGCRLLLTDFSVGMLETARANVCHPQVSFRQVDIQQIPFPDDSFDMVIANMMLYHVPDLDRGLSEVRRVLKPGGKFYCATYGQHGIMEFVNETLRTYGIRGSIGDSFTLQNGAQKLGCHFESTERLDREDGLAVTHIPDFVEYVKSMASLSGIAEINGEILLKAFTEKAENGILMIPKEYGMFICK